ncbi:SURF1 family protein [Neorhizobium lilium]|uniref:SURF1-like protein n=1 Tax=Neorhizobium lilium TaxID=2503024 RepID=A0A3S3RKT2_9HYPH|nr:SURF1 family protein [Neorhizobium lilium]RWX80791.1 SURF1 family protein [Neorhizobium lilium]
MRPNSEQEDKEGAAQAVPSASSGRSSVLLRAFLVLLTLVFTGLGSWQVQRLFWKLDLIARVEARVAAAPVAPPSPTNWSDAEAQDFEYRHVIVNGVFDHSRETLVQAVTERGPGFWVLTPLQLDGGAAVLINRGFVPPEKRDPVSRSDGNTSGSVTLRGLLRITEPGGGFLRANNPAQDRWFSRDVAAIAAAKGIANTAPYFIDADATPNPGGFPVGGLTVVTFRNSHLVYALTWFALAAMSLGALVYVRRLRAG